MKLQEAEPETTPEPIVEETAPVVETPIVEEATPLDTPPSVEKIVVDGEELTLEQIKEFRAGYSRTQDYTQKTQEIARIRRENQEAVELYEYLRSNPDIADNLLNSEQVTPADKQRLSQLDPRTASQAKLERELNDLKLQREIDTLSSKYSDFDVVKVLQTAYEKQMPNLEDAYKLIVAERVISPPSVESATPVSTPVDLEAERARIRAEVLAEMQAETESTKTLIKTNGGAPVKTETEITLTPEQDRVRRMQGLSIEEYKKWMTPTKQ
jgi:hypothetical protein